MRTFFTLILSLAVFAFIFSNCGSAKKVASDTPKSTYESSIQPLIATNCTPCHIPSKGGNKKAYDNFANVKTDIDEMIRRIELNPGEKGFMPFKHAKLSDSVIAVFKQFRADGVREK